MSLSVIFMLVAIIFITSVPFSNFVSANDDVGVSNLSLYNRASELAREFGTSLAPGTKQNFEPMYGNASAGTAGGLLGYADVMSDDSAVVGWLTSSFTTASVQLTYDQLENITGSRENNPFYDYAGYGEALNAMGLSKAVRGDTGSFARKIPTGLIMLNYMVATGISLIIGLALKVLVMFNPFKLFMGVFDATAAANLGILSAAARQVQYLYEAIQDISLYVLLPMFLVITVFSVLVFARGQALKRFGRYFLRVFMIFAGLPLIGATYTGVVEDLEASFSKGSTVADYLVYSSYVDFENWVRHSRLAPPIPDLESGVGVINHPRYIEEATAATDKMYTPSRQFILYLNGYSAGNERAKSIYNEFQRGGLTAALSEQGELEYVDASNANFGEGGMYAKNSPMDLLRRHFNNDKYSSSHYDGEVTGMIQQLLEGNVEGDETLSANDSEILRMFTLTASKHRTWERANDIKVKISDDDEAEDAWWNSAIDWSDSTQLLNMHANPNDEDANFRFSLYPRHIYNNGGIELVEFREHGEYVGGAQKIYVAGAVTSDNSLKGKPIHSGTEITGGLSPLAMYNFLNTTFDDTGLTIWSSEKSSSDQTRDTYVSVVHGTTGITSMLRWMESMALMSSMNLLTIAFGMMMIQIAITGIPRILTGAFGTALGSIASITKLLISTGVMLLQILGMLFFYYLSENIIVGMMVSIDSLFGSMGSYFASIGLPLGAIGLSDINFLSGNVFLETMTSIFMIIVVVGVTYFMIKFMGTFRNMLEEMVTDGIQRVMAGLDTSTGGKGHGLDHASVSGGRVGNDGKLKDDAKKPNLENLPIGGSVAKGLKGAHDLMSMREAQAEAMGMSPEEIYGEGASEKGIKGMVARTKGKMKNRFGKGGFGQEGDESLAKRMVRAARADARTDATVKPLFGISGSKFDRAMQAEQQRIQNLGRAKAYGRSLNDGSSSGGSDTQLEDVQSRLPQSSKDLMFNEQGELLDTNGDVYTDENGTPLMKDEKGYLVDNKGDYMQIGEDGVLEPATKPMRIEDEAKKLDHMRSDVQANEAMLEAQDNTHYGIDSNGQVVNADNEPIRTKDGLEVSLDAEGRMIDSEGNFVQPSDLKRGDLDTRGFEVKEDADGNTYLQHRGDDALRDGAKVENEVEDETINIMGADGKEYPIRKADQNKSLTAMAKEANILENRAKRAREKVDRLKANGASPYVIQQAERQANKLTNEAKNAQKRYDNHVASGAGRTGERVTKDHVETAKRSVNSAKQGVDKAKQTLNQEQAKLKELQQANKPVNEQKQVVQQAQQAQQKAEQQVESARKAVQTAQQEQQQAFAQHIANPTPQTKQAYDNAVAKTNLAKQNYSQAQQSVQQAKQIVQQSQQKLGQLEQQNQPTVQAQAKQEKVVQQAQKQYQQAQQSYQQAKDSAKYTNMAYQTKRSYGEVEQTYIQQRQAEQEYQEAYKQYVQAEQSGDSARIRQAQQKLNHQANLFTQASSNVEMVSQAPQGTTAQIDKANAEVMRLRNAQQNATSDRQRAQIAARLKRAEQRLENLQSPKGWFGEQATQEQVLLGANINQNQARQYMKTQGIASYNDYVNEMRNEQANVAEKRAELKRINSMLNSPIPMPASKRNDMVEQRANLRNEINYSNKRMNDLRRHASGMLDSKGFTPTVASRPIQKHGGQVVTQLSNLSAMQHMYDSLKFQQDNGTLDSSGEAQLQDLNSRMSYLRRELIGLGIQEEYLTNQSSIQKSIHDVQRSWISYTNGETRES